MTKLDMDVLAKTFKAIGVPVRLQILRYLMDNLFDKQPPVPTMIALQLQLTLPKVSHNLKILTDANITIRKQSGRYVFYTINNELIDQLKEFLT